MKRFSAAEDADDFISSQSRHFKNIILGIYFRRVARAPRIAERVCRAFRACVKIIINMNLPVPDPRRALDDVLVIVMVKGHLQFSLIRRLAVAVSDDGAFVMVMIFIIGQCNIIRPVGYIRLAVMVLIFSPVIVGKTAVGIRSVIKGAMIDPDVRRAVNGDIVIFRVPVAAAAVRRVPLRKIVVSVLKFNVADDDIVDAVLYIKTSACHFGI